MSRPLKKYGLGWKPNYPDYRDRRFAVAPNVLDNLPSAVDLRPGCPPVRNQFQIGACTAFALSAAIQFDRMKLGDQPAFPPSTLFLYYNERAQEGDVSTDSGAQLKTGMQCLVNQGICSEVEWPFDNDAEPAPTDGGPFPVGSRAVTKPPQSCYDDAINYRAASYEAVDQSLSQFKGAIASGFPFVFGFTLFATWYDVDPLPTTIPLPSGNDSQRGGHAAMACGYDDVTSLFTFQNSWGTDIGDKGFFYIPYSYLTDTNLSSDFWVIRTTTK